MTPSLVPIFRASFPDGYAHVGGMYMYQNYYSNMNGDISLAFSSMIKKQETSLNSAKLSRYIGRTVGRQLMKLENL